MSNPRWRFLEYAKSKLASLQAPAGLHESLIDRIEDAMSSTDRTRLTEANTELDAFVTSVHAGLPSELTQAFREEGDLGLVSLAYEVGQINFARHLVGRVLDRAAPADFVAAVHDKRYAEYLQALYEAERTGVELAKALNVRPETVGRVLPQLRAMGIIDCRREGTSLVNFLTPAARAAYGNTGDAKRRQAIEAERRSSVRARLDAQRLSLPTHLQSSVTFSSELDPAAPRR